MKIFRIRSLAEYQRHAHLMEGEYSARRAYEKSLLPRRQKNFRVEGFSYPAGKTVRFQADFVHHVEAGWPNWRETLRCPVTNLNNRLRASVHLLDIECSPYDRDRIFISEQVTAFYRYLAGHYNNVTGSEFVGKDLVPGSVTSQGILHEDLTELSFPDDSFDHLLTFDCLEHVPDYRKALRECCRILGPNGNMLFSVPFANHAQKNITRARLSVDGKIEHLMPPEYHGDPLSKGGCLCFRHFGWELLDDLKAVGFRDAYALLYWSKEYGYLGGEQAIFMAKK